MNNKKYYVEKFWNYSSDDLKDIIAARFREPSDEEISAAIEVLHKRSSEVLHDNTELSLSDIPSAPLNVLLEIVKNENIWGKTAIELAENEILRREHQKSSPLNQKKAMNPFMKAVLAVFAVVGTVLLVKLLIIVVFIFFLFYNLQSCLNNL